MNLNFATAILVGLMALCAFTLDCIASPKQSPWMAIPRFMRWEIRVTGAVFMIRSINLFSLSNTSVATIGQVNLVALTASLCMAITVVSFTVYAVANKLPAKAWDRLAFALRAMRQDPDTVPVMMKTGEVLDIHHALGQPAVAGTDPAGVPREGPRQVHMIERTRRRAG